MPVYYEVGVMSAGPSILCQRRAPLGPTVYGDENENSRTTGGVPDDRGIFAIRSSGEGTMGFCRLGRGYLLTQMQGGSVLPLFISVIQ